MIKDPKLKGAVCKTAPALVGCGKTQPSSFGFIPKNVQ
jgi:hypothetical protein